MDKGHDVRRGEGRIRNVVIYFVSDVHLGSRVMSDPAEHQRRFISLLEKMQQDASAIYLLGDVFDFWFEYYWPNERHFRQFEPVLTALREASSHCPVHLYVGNHDMWTFGWLAERTGVEVHYTPETLTLCGRKCLLAHGDGLGSTDRRFLFLRAFFHNPVPRFLFRLLPPAVGDWLGYSWAASSRRKEMKNPMGYAGEHEEELIRYAKQYTEPVDYFIFGHRHIELALMLSNKACVYILGDFFRQYTYAQMDDAGQLSIELYEA